MTAGQTPSAGRPAGPPALRTGRAAGRAGQRGSLTVLFSGLILVVLMTLALGWDAANWLIGQRRLGDLADGAAVAAAGELDGARVRASGGRDVVLDEARARATVDAYLTGVDGAAARSGLPGAVADVAAGTDALGRAEVTVRVRAPADAAFLSLLRLVPPEMEAEATATVVRVEPWIGRPPGRP